MPSNILAIVISTLRVFTEIKINELELMLKVNELELMLKIRSNNNNYLFTYKDL